MGDAPGQGTCEVSATVVGDHPGWGGRPRSRRARVTLGVDLVHVTLTFDDPVFGARVATGGGTVKTR